MKRTSIAIDEKLIKEAMKVTEIRTRKALVNFALRNILRHESSKRILELKEKEWKHHRGYERKPVKHREFWD